MNLCRGKQRGCLGYFEELCESVCPFYIPELNPDIAKFVEVLNSNLPPLDTTLLK